MDDLDRLLRRQAWSHQLAAPGKPKHQVLLDEAQGDVQIGRHEAFVDVDRDTPLRLSQPAMFGQRPRIVIHHAVLRRDLWPQDGVDLVWRGFAVQSGRDQDRHALDRDAGLVQAPEQRRQRQPVGCRPGDIANRDGRSLLAGRQGRQRLAADGLVQGASSAAVTSGKADAERLSITSYLGPSGNVTSSPCRPNAKCICMTLYSTG